MIKVKNVVCTFCGSLCDDIEVEIEANSIIAVKGGCALSRNKFLHAREEVVPLVEGKEASFPSALAAAVEILAGARHPLIYGLSSTSSEAQAAAVALAEAMGASIDSTSSVCHGPGTLAKQLVGIPTCTLGEVKNRADVVVFWGCNPVEAHPRHFARYSVQARGLNVAGRKERQVVVADVRKTATARVAELFLQIVPNGDFEVLTALRALVNGKDFAGEGAGGLSRAELEKCSRILRQARYGVFFFGMGLTMSRGSHYNVSQALALVRDLNQYTRFSVIPMRGHGNVAGSENVLAWQTGYPFAVNFSRGYPRYNPGEFTAVDLLRRREVDAALVVAADPAATLPGLAAAVLERIPTVVIDPHYSATAKLARVYLPSAAAGIGAAGTAYRMDMVPLPLKKLITVPYPSDKEILARLREGVERCSGSKGAGSMTREMAGTVR
ncbi:MAG: formylmethanofuran dehydrogenase subunit B [bacterium]|jgi:formylmethanofuran dehydrogenase subunit B